MKTRDQAERGLAEVLEEEIVFVATYTHPSAEPVDAETSYRRLVLEIERALDALEAA